jgi:hypothetical protein
MQKKRNILFFYDFRQFLTNDNNFPLKRSGFLLRYHFGRNDGMAKSFSSAGKN